MIKNKFFFTQTLSNGMLVRGGNTSRKGQKDRNLDCFIRCLEKIIVSLNKVACLRGR